MGEHTAQEPLAPGDDDPKYPIVTVGNASARPALGPGDDDPKYATKGASAQPAARGTKQMPGQPADK